MQNRPWRDPFNELRKDGTLISKREVCPFFLLCFCHFEDIFLFGFVFILIYSMIMFQGFVFIRQNDRKFSVCVSFKFGLSRIFGIRRLFSYLLPWLPSPEFLYIVIQCPLSPWPLCHNLVRSGQRTPLVIEEKEEPESLAWRFSRHNREKEIK